MKPRFFIFPCILSDVQFEMITEIRDQINSCKNDLCIAGMLHPHFNILKIDCIVNDLSEVLKNQIAKGWRYNSYVLNLSIVKLDYLLTLINVESNITCTEMHAKIVHCYEVLSQILSDCYVDYIDEQF